MKTQYIVLALLMFVLCAIAFHFGKGCGAPVAKPNVVTVHDTLPAVHEHDTLVVNRWQIKTVTQDGAVVELHDTTILRAIDTLILHERITALRACVDTLVKQDTVNICYDYVTRRFDARIGVPARVTEKEIAVPVKFLRGGLCAVADVDLNQNVFAGVGYHAMMLNVVDVCGVVGLQRAPFQATAHVQLRYDF